MPINELSFYGRGLGRTIVNLLDTRNRKAVVGGADGGPKVAHDFRCLMESLRWGAERTVVICSTP